MLRNSSITLNINNNIENGIEYGKMEYSEGIKINYETFKNLLSDEQTQRWIKDQFNNLFENYQKLICYLENVKNIANKELSDLSSINKNLLIIIKLKELKEKEDSNINNNIKNLNSEYNIENSPFRDGTYKDINILVNKNYEGFKSFSREIKSNPLQISSILRIENSISNSNGTLWAILEQINKHFFIGLSFIKVIGKHKKIAEKIKELDDGTFLSDGYNEIFKYNIYFKKIGIINFNNYYSFFLDKNKVIISQKNRFTFFNHIYSSIYTNYSCRNLFNFKNNNYIIYDKKGIFSGINIFNDKLLNHQYNELSKMIAYGGIKITDDILAITSNQVLSKGENKLIFFNSRLQKFLNNLEVKNYSFILSENNCALMDIPKQENSKLLLIACKKYIKDDRNGILLLKLQLHKDDIKIFQTFYDTKNFEVYCFCPIYEIIKNYIFDQNIKKNTEYFYVGGFDPDKRKGLIKLYKVIYNDEIEKIEIEYIQDIIIGKQINNPEDFIEHNKLVYSRKIDNTSNIEKYDEIIYETFNEKKEKYKTFDVYNEKIFKTNNEKKEKTNNEINFRINFEEKYNIYNEKFVKTNKEKKKKPVMKKLLKPTMMKNIRLTMKK